MLERKGLGRHGSEALLPGPEVAVTGFGDVDRLRPSSESHRDARVGASAGRSHVG